MERTGKSLLLIIFLFAFTIISEAQEELEIFIPRDIKKAYENGTRSADGKPGEMYFQNQVDYRIKAEIDPVSGLIRGSEEITFHNLSDRNLKYIVLRNYHDVFRKGAIRGRPVDPEDAGLGIDLKRLRVNQEELDPGDPKTFYARTATNFILQCKTKKGGQSVIEIDWETSIPKKTHERFGNIDDSSFFMAYWYPQVAVFDDINGWDVFDYNNLNEMYNEYGNFEVSLTLPEGYIVWATGELQNAGEVLTPGYYSRYEESRNSEKVVNIIGNKDIKKNRSITGKGVNEWKFRASMVNDFAFAASNHHIWSASTHRGDNGKKTHLQTAWLPASENYALIPDYMNWMTSSLEEYLGYPFPYPSITVFNGLDGMEFPMIVNDDEMDTPGGTYFLSTHEVAHSYFPFLVGINQKRHGWLDEGLVTMTGVEVHTQKINEYNFRDTYLEWYPLIAGTQNDIPSMVNSVYITDLIYQEHEYVRSASAFWILKDILGPDMFARCLTEFIDRWKFRHPTPYDFFFTFNDVSGENLNWFFQSWFIDFGYPDLGIGRTEEDGEYWKVEIINHGGMPFPSVLEIYSETEKTGQVEIDARLWKDVKKSLIINLPKNISNTKFVLNTDNYPDADLSNNAASAGR